VGFTVFQGGELDWEDRGDGSGRRVARFSDAMTTARANVWSYPPGARGRRHADKAQEETFVVLRGTPSMHLGEPPERIELSPGSVVVVEPGTPLQLRNDGPDEAVFFIVGAPPDTAGADFFDDAEP
jgi:mannose-6-phosphate isomerase-like protein (cupin superfamily)